jgi:anti-anti-sigma factor
MPRELELRIEASGREVTVRVGGELDAATAPELSSCLELALADSGRPVVIDLRDVTFLDSWGVDAVVSAANRAGRPGAVRVEGASAFVHRVLRMTYADAVIDLR